jgi:hypothetical protein
VVTSSRLTRSWLRLLQAAGLIGLGLSVVGWVAVSVQRTLMILDGTAGPFGRPLSALDAVLFVLDGMKEAAIPLFLSALLLAVCEIALRLTPRTTPREES